MTTLKLRSYQEECLTNIIYRFNSGICRQLIHLPTGSGKTVVFAHLIAKTKRRSLVLANTCELLEQAKDKIQMICPNLDVGIVNSKRKEFDNTVVVCSIQSARQPETLNQLQNQNFTLLVADECHHFAAETPKLVLSTLGFHKNNEEKKLLTGFSATPFRSDGKGLGEVFDEIVYQKNIKEMINEGYLCTPNGIKIATDLDLSKVAIENEDFSSTSLSKVMDNDQINDLVVHTYLKQAYGRKSICFGVSINHAQHLAERFNLWGVSAGVIHGNMTMIERVSILKSFKNGEISVLTNCQVLTEGFDCPEVDCVIVARPTQSIGLYQQMVGRGLRLFPQKTECLVLDFGDKNHTICNTALLIGDSDLQTPKTHLRNTKMVSLSHSLPPKINQKLKSAILEFNPLGDTFFWQKDASGSYQMKGSGNKIIKITLLSEDRYDVIFSNNNNFQFIARNLSFEYAFAAAEDYAKSNRSLFSVSDLEADWRKLPISDRQKNLFHSHGFKSGIGDLTRGQAATIISSGVLSRKAVRR